MMTRMSTWPVMTVESRGENEIHLLNTVSSGKTRSGTCATPDTVSLPPPP